MDDTALTTLLSHAVLAFAIEFDNEFEQEMRKTYARPFGVSIVMWSNFMRFVGETGTPIAEIVEASCIPKEAVVSVVGGTERWGYVTVDHDPKAGAPLRRSGFGSGRGVKLDTVLYPSMTGKLAIDRWEPLVAEIERRWRERFGGKEVDALRDALGAVDVDAPLPHFLPS